MISVSSEQSMMSTLELKRLIGRGCEEYVPSFQEEVSILKVPSCWKVMRARSGLGPVETKKGWIPQLEHSGSMRVVLSW